MSDVERITTTERHAELRHQIAAAVRGPMCDGMTPWEVADAVLPIIERERVQVVEGLVATIKALRGHAPDFVHDWDGWEQAIARVLAVVEAAREDAQ